MHFICDKHLQRPPLQVCALPSGHLCRYPLHINGDGTVENIPGVVNFPDTNASVLGKNGSLPDALTT